MEIITDDLDFARLALREVKNISDLRGLKGKEAKILEAEFPEKARKYG